ncbi:unnamed protein product [Penicillium salamii]|nr:unnamed protein product [Penicillium salamii]
MRVERMQRELLHLFATVYRLNVQTYVIPLVTTQLGFTNFLDEWLNDNQGERVLRIVIYSGHARAGGPWDTEWFSAGGVNRYGNLQGPRLNWGAIQRTLNTYPGETCWIFDCYSVGSLAL